MKQAEIKNDTDYIIGPSSNLFEGAGYRSIDDSTTYLPHRMSRVRIVDNRAHKHMSGYYGSDKEPKLVGEGEKPNRSLYTVGPLARRVKPDGTLADKTLVVRPQNVRMEWDAWREEFTREHARLKIERARERQRRADEELAREAFLEDRNRRMSKLNALLKGTGIEAKATKSDAVVLTGSPADLLAAAEKIAKVDVP